MMLDIDGAVRFFYGRVDEPIPNIFLNGDEEEERVYHVFLEILCILLIVVYLQLSHVVAQQFTAAQ